MPKHLKFKLFVLFLITLLSLYFAYPSQKKPLFGPGELLSDFAFRLGLDLQGGSEIRLRFKDTGKKFTAEEERKGITNAVSILERRINVFGLREPRIQAFGQDQVLVQLPGAAQDEIERIKKVLEKSGHVDFRMVAGKDQKEGPGWRYFSFDHPGSEPLLLESNPSMNGEHMVSADVRPGCTNDPLKYRVDFVLDAEGAEAFGHLTSANVGRQMAILLDNKIVSDPVINSPITGGSGLIECFAQPQAEDLATILKTGSLLAPLEVVGEETVGPTLGDIAIHQGKEAVLFSVLLVAAFMIIYYGLAGIISVLAVFLHIALILAFLSLFKATLTLPGIAGIVLTEGMALDANILIFERLREELKAGKTLFQAFEAGHDRALTAIIDTNITTLFAGLILIAFGTGPIKGFGITLSLGVVITIFTQVYAAKWLLEACLHGQWIKQFRFRSIFTNPKFDFMAIGLPCIVLSTLINLGAIAIFFYRGTQNMSIDFMGGTILGVQFQKPMGMTKVRQIIAQIKTPKGLSKYPDVELQGMGRTSTSQAGFFASHDYDRFQIRTSFQDEKVLKKDIQKAFQAYLVQEAIPTDEIVSHVQEKGLLNDYARLKINFAQPREKEPLTQSVKEAFKDNGWHEPFLKPLETTENPSPSPERAGEKGKKPEAKETWVSSAYLYIHPSDAGELETIVTRIKTALQLQETNPFLFVTNIGSQVAKDLKQKAIWAVLLSWLVIIIYLWWRFEFSFGMGAVIALVHDILVTVGVTCLAMLLMPHTLGVSLQMGLSTIAALLAISGYSVNDTIVTFDRLRENMKLNRREALGKLLNLSINQTLGRSVLTSFTVFLVSVILFAFTSQGATSMAAFSFPFIIGTITGTYSSIYIAGAFVYYLRK